MLHSSPWAYTYSHLYQMIIQHWPKGPWWLSDVTPKITIFQPPNASLKTAKSSEGGGIGQWILQSLRQHLGPPSLDGVSIRLWQAGRLHCWALLVFVHFPPRFQRFSAPSVACHQNGPCRPASVNNFDVAPGIWLSGPQ